MCGGADELQGRSSESQLQTEVQVLQEGLANAQAEARRWREEAQQQVRAAGRSWLGTELAGGNAGCRASDVLAQARQPDPKTHILKKNS